MANYSSMHSTSLLNDMTNLSEILKNYNSRINEKISKCNKIDIEELKLFCDKIINESEKYNSNLENWYDSNYHEDIAKLYQNILIFDEKINIFNISNAIVIN
jgi:hypothetical protein